MIPVAMRDFSHQLLSATEVTAVKWGNLTDTSYSVNSNDVLLILNIGDESDFHPKFISLSAFVDKQNANFKVFEDEEDYRFMIELLAAVQVNAGDMPSKLQALFV